MYSRSYFSQKICTRSCTFLKSEDKLVLDGKTTIKFGGNIKLEWIKEDGDIASQSSTLEPTGVSG